MSSHPRFEIAVIVINYNSSSYTINCLQSIYATTSSALSYQIIVVDNNSEFDDYQVLCNHMQLHPDVKTALVRSKINTGFGGGNMFGVQHADARYFAFINNDTLLKNDCLTLLLAEMKTNPNIGLCGPMCYTTEGKLLPTIDHFTTPLKEFLGRDFLEKINPAKYPKRKFEFTTNQKVQFVSGSFMLVNANDFNQIGGFDTNLFLYYEETDVCYRLSKINKDTYLIPSAKYVHFHGASTPRSRIIKAELKISFLYVIRKHHGFFWHQVVLNKLRLQFLFKCIIKPSYFYIFKVLLKGAHLSQSLKQKQQLWHG